MEGALLKWTNYLLGWQPRYFVLDSGILSYYDSQDDVGKGSKGSIKMAVCEIKVHPTDATRMELVIPGEQYFYLKAGGAAERQKWLVALGSSKACLGDSRSQKDKDVHLSSESLGRKLSELRLYCDVLTQQVLDVQESTRPQDNGTPLDIEKMNEAASLLKATCSQFISTLEECMKFANARLAPELYQPSPAPLPQDFVGTKLPHSHRVRRSLSHTGIVSPDRGAEPPRTPVPPQKGAVTVVRNLEEMVMFRSQHWSQQGPAPDSPVGTIVEEREVTSQRLFWCHFHGSKVGGVPLMIDCRAEMGRQPEGAGDAPSPPPPQRDTSGRGKKGNRLSRLSWKSCARRNRHIHPSKKTPGL
ncbi:pleckstrin homology domain-containing family A member 3-like isoform X4 [Lepidochelys kempii]|uniref:pleckstrin homology domain-containing family A member 3-like isoform X4 n=1 Tax=Lepidochelys kempii TaxID=8472 RepID=UPI003C6F1B1D